MKIYNRIVLDFDFNVIEEDSYEYDGDTAKCDGGGGGDASSQGMADAQANSEAGSIGGDVGGFGGADQGGFSDTGFGTGYSGDVSAQGMADAQANSQTSYGSTGHVDTSGATGMAAIDTSTVNPNNLSVSQAQSLAAAADAAVAQSTWSNTVSFAKSVAKGMIAGIPAGFMGMTLGAIAGATKAAVDQYGKSYTASTIASDLANLSTNTGQTTTGLTGATPSQNGGVSLDYVWDGNYFVSPTSASGQKAIAQATGGTSGMSNLSLEDQLKTEQLEILRQQRSESDALNKLIYQAAGIIKDPVSGEWRKASESEKRLLMTDTERQEYDLYLKQLERQQMALEGKLPISPALEREISDWDTENKEALSRRLGSGYMTSTPGIQSMNRQQERTGLLREEARRGEISAGSSRVLDWKNSLNNQNAQSINTLAAIPGRTSGLLSGYANTLVPYTQQNSINAANDRQSQLIAQDTYWKRQAQKQAEEQSKWSTIGQIGGWLFS